MNIHENARTTPASRALLVRRVQQHGGVAMYGLYIPVDAPSSFADRDRAGIAKRFQQLPPLRAKHLPKQLRRRKGDASFQA